jgi:type IV secretory pathway VirB10-like protein
MRSVLGRRIAAVAGGSAVTAMVILTASCAKEEEKAPETSTTTTTTTTTEAPAPSPTEKAPRLDPTGPNPFSPTVIAPPAPTAVPGDN